MNRMLTLIVFLWTVTLGAQVRIYKYSVDSGTGASMSAANLRIVYGVGEIATREVSAYGLHLSEGFVGPDFSAFLGTEDYETLEGIKVFPNPTSGAFSVSLPREGEYEFHLFDASGKQILFHTVKADRATFHPKHFPSGFYFLVVIDRTHRKQLTLKIEKL